MTAISNINSIRAGFMGEREQQLGDNQRLMEQSFIAGEGHMTTRNYSDQYGQWR